MRASGSRHDASVVPRWHSIAFVSSRDGNREIYVVDVAGGNLRNLSNHQGMIGRRCGPQTVE